jgi:hypothetical protein
MNMTHYLRVDAVHFDSFLFDTDDLSTVRGGSLLLLDSGTQVKLWLQEFFGETQNREATESPHWQGIVQAASIGIFELNLTGAQPAELQKRLEEKLLGDEAFAHATFSVDLQPAGRSFAGSLAGLVALNRHRKFTALSLAVPEWQTTDDTGGPCRLDRLRPGAEEVVLPEGERAVASRSVALRRSYGRDQKSKFYRDLTGKDLRFSNDLHDIAGAAPHDVRHLDEKIAVIYLDGNHFGDRIREQAGKGPENYRKVSNQIADQRKEMLSDLLSRMEHDKTGWMNRDRCRIETLLWGGDEIIWVVPAWKGWETLRFFYESAKGWTLTDADTVPLTHSAGLVFAHAKAPIQRLTTLARQLAERAKEAAERKANAFACEVLESYDHTGTNLEDYYRRRYGCWKCKRDGEVESGWLGFDHLVLRGESMAAIQHAMHNLEQEQFPRRRLHVNAKAVLNTNSAAAATTALEADAALIKDLPLHLAPAGGTGANPAAWLHAAMLWDYVARVPQPSCSNPHSATV